MKAIVQIESVSLKIAPIENDKAMELAFSKRINVSDVQIRDIVFSLSVECTNYLGETHVCAAAVVGLPKFSRLNDGRTLEVYSLWSNGRANALTKLYSACWRVAREMGYLRIITLVFPTESSKVIKDSGWTNNGKIGDITVFHKASSPYYAIESLFGDIASHLNEKQ